jgi:hypothetical protein
VFKFKYNEHTIKTKIDGKNKKINFKFFRINDYSLTTLLVVANENLTGSSSSSFTCNPCTREGNQDSCDTGFQNIRE